MSYEEVSEAIIDLTRDVLWIEALGPEEQGHGLREVY
jgi:hypothetical protein